MSEDLNRDLGNHAISCAQAAATNSREAEIYRGKQKSGWNLYDDANEDKARYHDRIAERYAIRAGYATKGLFADHVHAQADDEAFSYRQTHSELHDRAAAQGRSVPLDMDNNEIA